MLKSVIIWGAGPVEAGYGDTISYRIWAQNIGDEAGYFFVLIRLQEDPGQTPAVGEWAWLDPAVGRHWDLSLIMPGHDDEVWAESYHWDAAAQEPRIDDDELIAHVTLTGVPVEGNPAPKIISLTIDDQVVAGAQVRAVVGLRNEGTGRGWCRPLLWWRLGGEEYEASPVNVELNPGESRIFDIYFTMPDATIQVMAVAQWWEFDSRIWWASDEKGPFTVEVVGDPWPHLALPSWIVSALDFFNWPKGSWEPIDIPIVDVPPWDIMIGEKILDGLQYPVDWLNWTIQQVKSVWGVASAAWDTAVEAWNNADSALEGLIAVPAAIVSTFWSALWPDAWSLVTNLTNTVTDWATAHFGEIWDRLNALEGLDISFDGLLAFVAEHLGEIEPFKTLFDTFNAGYQFMADVGDEAWAFFSNPVDWIFDKIESWFDEPVSKEPEGF